MEPYDAEFRGEVLAACDTNEERRVIALRFKVSESWLRRIQQQRRETGQVAPRKAAPRQPEWHAWADWLVGTRHALGGKDSLRTLTDDDFSGRIAGRGIHRPAYR